MFFSPRISLRLPCTVRSFKCIARGRVRLNCRPCIQQCARVGWKMYFDSAEYRVDSARAFFFSVDFPFFYRDCYLIHDWGKKRIFFFVNKEKRQQRLWHIPNKCQQTEWKNCLCFWLTKTKNKNVQQSLEWCVHTYALEMLAFCHRPNRGRTVFDQWKMSTRQVCQPYCVTLSTFPILFSIHIG